MSPKVIYGQELKIAIGGPGSCRDTQKRRKSDSPLLPGRSPLGELVDAGETADDLILEFVLRRPGGRVAPFPEGFDEDVPVRVDRQFEKDFPLDREDDIVDEFQPALVFRPRVLFGSRPAGDEKAGA